MTESPPANPARKSRWGWCCAGCVILPLLTSFCLVAAFFLVPWLSDALNLFGPGAEEVYSQAPDLAASREVEQVFAGLGIPGVRVYVIPIKDQPTQGAFVILDASRGYRGLNPSDSEDDQFLKVVQQLSQANRDHNLRLTHVTVEYRDGAGERATAFTAPQVLIDELAAGAINQDQFFSQIEIDLLTTIQYLELEQLLEELQQ